MNLRHIPSLMSYHGEKMQKHNVFETERFFCDVYCLLPGQQQKAHAHAGEDKVYVVLEGTVTVLIDHEETVIGKGMAALAAAGQSHGLRNDSGAPCSLLVFMAPHP